MDKIDEMPHDLESITYGSIKPPRQDSPDHFSMIESRRHLQSKTILSNASQNEESKRTVKVLAAPPFEDPELLKVPKLH